MASINKEWIGLTLAAALMACAIGWSCAAAKPVVQWAAQTCEQIATAQGDAELLAACESAEAVSNLMAKRRADAGAP